MTTLFISDLHLDGSRPTVTKLFFEFLSQDAREADALYILGDLFEAWIGDDDDDTHHQAVIGRLQDSARHVPIFIMRGNRDFLLGERFQAMTGCHLLSDSEVVDLYGEPTLLLHGDTLCIDDIEYQKFRALARDPAWQQMMLAKPLAERRAIAKAARDRSTIENSMKADAIMDVNATAVTDAMQAHSVRRLIHGHTHRPAVHQTAHGARIVLGDWHEQGSVLRVDASGFELAMVE